ncbi:hypothetical protein [Tautonia plasticadhaerens]|uniref:hypothetical protein n=1 Tax=Tautonia plasticadhaerens TaxID=2527974 RepID=UPI0011A74E94|nr:hypothetical protein [Tautonia plasticadhaerens]
MIPDRPTPDAGSSIGSGIGRFLAPEWPGRQGDPPAASAAGAPGGAAAVLRDGVRPGVVSGRRGKTVEPFSGRFPALFVLDEHVWHAGLGNNFTQVLAALLLYQILPTYDRIKGHDDAGVNWILDLL